MLGLHLSHANCFGHAAAAVVNVILHAHSPAASSLPLELTARAMQPPHALPPSAQTSPARNVWRRVSYRARSSRTAHSFPRDRIESAASQQRLAAADIRTRNFIMRIYKRCSCHRRRPPVASARASGFTICPEQRSGAGAASTASQRRSSAPAPAR